MKRVANIRLLLNFLLAPEMREPTRLFIELRTQNGAQIPRRSRRSVALLSQRENHVDFGIHFHGLAVEQGWLIAPLPYSVQRGLHEQGMARNHDKLLHRAILANDGVELHRATDARLARQGRVKRLYFVDEPCCLHVAANHDTLRNYLRWWWSSFPTANHSAKHAAHRTTRDAARHAAGDTLHAGVRWQLLFLDDVYFFRDGFRGHELTGIHQADGRPDLHLHDCGRWRRRRGRRWRQKDGRHHGPRQRLGVNQRNENQNHKEQDLQNHGHNHGPRLVRLLFCT